MTRWRSCCVLTIAAFWVLLPQTSASASARTWSNPPVASTGDAPLLAGVSCVSAQFCVAVGDQQSASETAPLVDLWNGDGWSVMPLPALATVHSFGGVSCVTISFCVAVGSQDVGSGSAPLIVEWDGSSWTVVSSPSTPEKINGLLGVSCVSTTSCVAVGSSAQDNTIQPLTEVWNGVDWTIAADAISGASAYMSAVSCPTSSFCMGVGYSYDPTAHVEHSLFEQWNGSDWTILDSPVQSSTEQSVNGVSCLSSSWCVAVGANFDDGLVATTYAWDGTSWSLQNVLGGGTIDEALFSVDCLSRTRCVATGAISDSSRRRHAPPLPPLIESWNGSNWKVTGTRHEPRLLASLLGVSCSRVTKCAAVGYGQGGAIGLVSG